MQKFRQPHDTYFVRKVIHGMNGLLTSLNTQIKRVKSETIQKRGFTSLKRRHILTNAVKISHITSHVEYIISPTNVQNKILYDMQFTFLTGILGQLLLSFSVYTNGAKILNTHQGAGTLAAVNGIRFISMTWVILGHSIGFGAPNMCKQTRLIYLKFK